MIKQFERAEYFNLEQEIVLQNCKALVREFKFKVIFEDCKKNTIIAYKEALLSRGSNIYITYKEGMVYMRSECISVYALHDWGRNKRNVVRFFKKLRKRCSGH